MRCRLYRLKGDLTVYIHSHDLANDEPDVTALAGIALPAGGKVEVGKVGAGKSKSSFPNSTFFIPRLSYSYLPFFVL